MQQISFMISCIYKIHTLQKIYDRDRLCSHLTGFYHFVSLFIAQDLLIAFYLNYPCIKLNKCQKTSFCIAFELILAFSLYFCGAGFSLLSSQYTFFSCFSYFVLSHRLGNSKKRKVRF